MESKTVDSWAENIGSFPISHCYLQLLIATFILPCAQTKYITNVREHWRCQSWETNTLRYVVSSKDTTVSKPNYHFSNQGGCSKGKEKWGAGEKKGVTWKMGSGITCTKISKQKEAIQNNWRKGTEVQKFEVWPSSSASSPPRNEPVDIHRRSIATRELARSCRKAGDRLVRAFYFYQPL